MQITENVCLVNSVLPDVPNGKWKNLTLSIVALQAMLEVYPVEMEVSRSQTQTGGCTS